MKRDDEYFEAARSWDADRVALMEQSKRHAWQIVWGSWGITGLALIALAGFTLFKPMPPPFVVRVDNTTGVIDVLQGYDASAGMEEQVTRFLLQTYIETCETYTAATAERAYYKCAHYNSATRNTAWLAQWNLQNPSSPVNLHKDGSTVIARVKSISFFTNGAGKRELASIRFTKTAQAGSGGAEVVTDWIATVAFTYAKPSAEANERADNPFGFRVVDYRTENEVGAPK